MRFTFLADLRRFRVRKVCAQGKPLGTSLGDKRVSIGRSALIDACLSVESPFAIADDSAYRGDNWIPAFAGKVDKGKVAPTDHRIYSTTFEQGYLLKFDASADRSMSWRSPAFEMCEHDRRKPGEAIQFIDLFSGLPRRLRLLAMTVPRSSAKPSVCECTTRYYGTLRDGRR